MKIAMVSMHANPLGPRPTIGSGDPQTEEQRHDVATLASGLAERGHHVTVYCRRERVRDNRILRGPGGYQVELVNAGPAAPVPTEQHARFVSAFSDQLRGRWSIGRPDLVHAHFWTSGLAAVRAARSQRLPVLMSFHGTDPADPNRVAVERHLCQEVHHALAGGAAEVVRLVELGLPLGHVTIVPAGVDTDLFRPGRPGRPPEHDILLAGGASAQDGVDDMLEAMRLLPDRSLTVCADTTTSDWTSAPSVQRVARLATRLRVADRVGLVAWADPRQMPMLLQSARVVVRVPRRAPVGRVALQAMACGTPVVCTAVGDAVDSVITGSTGELVAPRRPEELAPALRSILDDPGRHETYARAARRHVLLSHDDRHVVEVTERAYSALAAQPAVARLT